MVVRLGLRPQPLAPGGQVLLACLTGCFRGENMCKMVQEAGKDVQFARWIQW